MPDQPPQPQPPPAEPPAQPTEAQIARIDALTATGRTNWFGLMAYLVFAFITVLGVSDADFFIPSRQTQLPLVNVEIPTKSFFYFAPILAVALFAYLHLHIRKVTAALCAAPATVDGIPLERYISPWLLNDLVLRWRRRGAIDRMPMDWLATLTTVALIWLAGPFVLAAIWVRSWPAHDEWMTTIAGLCLVLSLYVGHTNWVWMIRELHPARPRFPDVVRYGILMLAAALAIGLGGVKTEWGRLPDPTARPWRDFRFHQSQRWHELWEGEGTRLSRIRSFAAGSLTQASPNWVTRLASARLAETQFSVLPPDQNDPAAAVNRFRAEWCERLDLGAAACDEPPSPGTNDLRNTWCRERGIASDEPCQDLFKNLNDEFLGEWLRQRKAGRNAIPKPDLRRADLRGADLTNASLIGVILREARLDGADLRAAQMEGVDLAGAQIRQADLRDTELSQADLYRADFSYSIVSGRDGWPTELPYSVAEGTIAQGTALRHIDVRVVWFDDSTDITNSFGDATVLLPIPDEDRPCQWAKNDLTDSDEEFYARWRGWLTLDPDAPPWEFIAPPEWQDVEPALPDDYPTCTWHD